MLKISSHQNPLLKNNANEKAIYGIDYLRFLFCIDIVIWHSEGYRFIKNPILYYITTFYFGTLGVPIFFQISLFLFTLKIINNEEKTKYLIKRLKILFTIYLFWLPINFILLYDNFYVYFTNIIRFCSFLLGGNTPLFYIPILIILTYLTFILIKVKDFLTKFNRLYLSLIFVLLIFSLILMLNGDKIFKAINFRLYQSNPFNFLPYIFTSILIALFYEKLTNETLGKSIKNSKKLTYLIILLIIVFIIVAAIETFAYKQDWIILGYRIRYKNLYYIYYARISLVILSPIILLCCFYIEKKPRRIFLYISEISLGIFVIHYIVIKYCGMFVLGFGINLPPLIFSFLVLLISIVIISVLKYKIDKIL